MALFDDASLVVTPNGYQAGTLYSIKPTSGAGDMFVDRLTTATRVNSAGLIESVANKVPRLDYSNGTCPSLLVEPQRTNILLYSEQFENAYWGKYQTSLTANSVVSPDGNTTADTVTVTTGTGGSIFLLSPLTGTYTVSIFMKAGTSSVSIIEIAGVGNVDVNLSAGTFTTSGSVTGTIKSFGSGWHRCTATFTGTLVPYIAFGVTGTTGKTIYLWGAQLEAGSYATSYIPTTSAAVTRNADAISKTGISSLIGQTEGVLFTDFVCDGNASDVVLMQVIGNNGKFFWFRENGVQFYGNGTTLLFDYSPGSATYGQRYKLAFVYGQNDFQLYRDGTLLSSITSGTFSGSFDDIILPPILSAPYDGSIKHNIITLFPTKLTNAECISLTTL
jgi:hypothetical protein